MPPFSLHGRASLLALLPIALFALYIGARDGMRPEPGTADVGIQLTEAAAVTFTVGTRGDVRLIEIAHGGDKPVGISVPDTWTRTEVRGVPLSAVTEDEPSLGYVRWMLPPKAVVSFRSLSPFSGIRVHNPSDLPLTARMTAVDLDTKTTFTDSRILQGSAVTLLLEDIDMQRLP